MNRKASEGGIGISRFQRVWVLGAGIVFVCAAGLGYWGFDQYYRELGRFLSVMDLAYLSLQLFVLQSGMVEGTAPWMLVVARMMAALFTASTVIVALGSLCRSEIRSYRLSRLKGHAVVCGVGRKAQALVKDLIHRNYKVVLIDLNTDKRLLQNLEGPNVFAFEDDATRPGCLERARVHAAKHVFIATGNDSTNVEITSQVVHALRKRCRSTKRGRLACHVHLVDGPTTELFRRNHVFKEAEALVDIQAFNVYDNAARLLWRRDLMARGPLEPKSTCRMHVVIGGMGQMAEAILLRIARSGHYANGRKPAVTFVAPGAEAAWSKMSLRHPMVGALCDVATIEGDVSMPDVATRIKKLLATESEIGSIVLCADQDHENFATALQLSSTLDRADIPIRARVSLANGLAELLDAERSEASLARRIDAFGLVSECCSLDAVLEGSLFQFAREFHQAYVQARLLAGVKPSEDAALKDWETLDEQYRDSNRELAEHTELKLRTFGYSGEPKAGKLPRSFTEQQILVLAQMEHARWCAERFLAGWTYAPTPKDLLRRTSPNLVPWEKLDESIRQIDRDAVSAIPSILAQAGTK